MAKKALGKGLGALIKKQESPSPIAQKTAPKKKVAVATEQPPLDTQSILAAARKSQADRPGPITKAEAIAQGNSQ